MLRNPYIFVPSLVFNKGFLIREQITEEIAVRDRYKISIGLEVSDFNKWVNNVKEVIKTEINSFKLTTPYINDGWRDQLQSIPPFR
jgi:hypothetical protein